MSTVDASNEYWRRIASTAKAEVEAPHILVADRIKTWRGLLKKGLEEAFGQGSVTEAATYDEALDEYTQHQPPFAAYVISGSYYEVGLANKLNPQRFKLKPTYVISALETSIREAQEQGLKAFSKADENVIEDLVNQMRADFDVEQAYRKSPEEPRK